MMFVLKRDGRKEPVHFDKITARITKLSYGLNTDFCDPVSLRRMSSLSCQKQSWVCRYWINLLLERSLKLTA